MGGKQLGFGDYEQSTAKKSDQTREVSGRDGAGGALAADD
jgi:hypothetical protein